MKVFNILIFSGLLLNVWPASRTFAQTPEACNDAFYESRNKTQIYRIKCLDDAEARFNECMAFPNNLILGIRQDCHDLRGKAEELCRSEYDLKIESARKDWKECTGVQNPDAPFTVIVSNVWNNPDELNRALPVLLGFQGIATGDEFEKAAKHLAKVLPGTVDVLLTNPKGGFDPQDIPQAAYKICQQIDEYYFIEHGIDGVQLVGDTPLTGEYLEQVCQSIRETAAPGGRIYLCGCNVGFNAEYCQEIADRTGCFVYAKRGVVEYGAPSDTSMPPINLEGFHLRGVPALGK